MFRVNVSRTFKAAHALRNYNGSDEQAHDHDWKCEISAIANSLDSSGCAVDFVKIDRLIDEIVHPFRNTPFNSTKPFDEISPSAENIAKYIYDKASDVIDTQEVKVSSVTVWEDPEHSVRYFID